MNIKKRIFSDVVVSCNCLEGGHLLHHSAALSAVMKAAYRYSLLVLVFFLFSVYFHNLYFQWSSSHYRPYATFEEFLQDDVTSNNNSAPFQLDFFCRNLSALKTLGE